jgi:methionyl aminopeptidase
VLKDGDIIGIDTAVSIDGYHGDNAYTFPVGDISPSAARLLKVTRSSLYDAIAEAKPGNRIGDISSKLQDGAESQGFSVLQNFAGHGIGRNLHEAPEIPCMGVAGRGLRLRPGMVLAIETMVNVGLPDVQILADGWSVATLDGTLSALFEHTVAILSDGPEILTGSSLWEI